MPIYFVLLSILFMQIYVGMGATRPTVCEMMNISNHLGFLRIRVLWD